MLSTMVMASSGYPRCERENPTMSSKAISNYTKLFGGWCNYLG